MSQKIYIVCGPDNCGKTEIAKEFARINGFQYFKNHVEHSYFTEKNAFLNALHHDAVVILNFLKQVSFEGNGIVLDRGLPCEYAYSRAFNRETDEQFIWKLDEEYASIGTKIIYIYKTKYQKYDDHLIPLDKIELIKQYYVEYLWNTKMTYATLDSSDENLQKQIEYLNLSFSKSENDFI